MSKNELCKRLEKIEEKTTPKKLVILKMWRPDGLDMPYHGGPVKIEASNKGEANSE